MLHSAPRQRAAIAVGGGCCRRRHRWGGYRVQDPPHRDCPLPAVAVSTVGVYWVQDPPRGQLGVRRPCPAYAHAAADRRGPCERRRGAGPWVARRASPN